MELNYCRHLVAARPDGVRVQTHPATDAWMQGDRYGTITKVGRALVHVKMDRSGRVRKFRPCDLGTC